MRKNTLTLLTFLSLMLGLVAQAEPVDRGTVEAILNRSAVTQDDMFKVTFPRHDLDIRLDGIKLKPALALTTWFAFKPHGPNHMVMGDFVLKPDEVPRVQQELIKRGFRIQAMHNHLIGIEPSVIYTHIEGHGQPEVLAQHLKEVLAKTATPKTVASPEPVNSDWTGVENVFQTQGKKSGSVIQFSFPRQETIYDSGMVMPPFMGTATGIKFQRLDNDQAAVTGDFVMLAGEVEAVVRTLVENGITVTALHNHMQREEPRLFYMHFWGVDKPENLARSLKAALGQTNSTLPWHEGSR